MNLAQQLDEALVEHVYDDLLKGSGGLVAKASARLKANAPNIRDVRQETYAFLGSDSDNDRAVIVFVSDSKEPDVFRVTGNRQRQLGRPKGSKSGAAGPRFAGFSINQTTPYNNGVDMSNITNGAIRPAKVDGFPKQLKTGRSKPMPTEGWWIRALRDAAAVFGR